MASMALPLNCSKAAPSAPAAKSISIRKSIRSVSGISNRPDSLREIIAMVNRIRRENPALQSDRNLEFHTVDNDQLICFSKRTDEADDIILVVVNMDPYRVQSGFLDLPLDRLKIDETVPYQAHDLLTGARYIWTGRRNYVELSPSVLPAHILRLRRRIRAENDFEYFA